jgi:hypothetical protein
MKKIFIVMLAMTLSAALYSQNIRTATLRWNAVTTTDINAGDMTDENTQLISYPDHIEWKAPDGTLRYSPNILETNGTWTNVSKNGEIIFEIDNKGNRGTVQFVKQEGVTKVRLLLLTDSEPLSYELTITTTEVL